MYMLLLHIDVWSVPRALIFLCLDWRWNLGDVYERVCVTILAGISSSLSKQVLLCHLYPVSSVSDKGHQYQNMSAVQQGIYSQAI